jgi:hypothetical protein
MARGGSRPNSGRRRKPLATHLLAGTYRADRHGPLPGNVVPMPAAGWQPSSEDVEQLGAVAQDWLAATLRLYQLDELEGRKLMQALTVLTRIEAMETEVTSGGLLTADGGAHPLLSKLNQERRLFASLWDALRLGK